MRHVAFARKYGVERIVVSIKSTDVQACVEANTIFGALSDVPLHVGVTEAGDMQYGPVKSAAGIGALLLRGIGDTIRVSLTADPLLAIPVAYDILKCTGVRVSRPRSSPAPPAGASTSTSRRSWPR